MNVLILQHHPAEPAGTLGAFLADKGCALDVRHLYAGQALPADDAGYGLIVSMGGPMNVYDEAEHPWLVAETALLRRALLADRPVLGVCLGSQLMAKALGAPVTRSPRPEVGWFQIELTPAGLADPLLAGLDERPWVLQWHNDMFHIPAGAELLAASERCPHQAFRFGRGHALQFHVEVDAAIVDQWCENPAQRQEIAPGWADQGKIMNQHAQRIYDNLWAMLSGR